MHRLQVVVFVTISLLPSIPPETGRKQRGLVKPHGTHPCPGVNRALAVGEPRQVSVRPPTKASAAGMMWAEFRLIHQPPRERGLFNPCLGCSTTPMSSGSPRSSNMFVDIQECGKKVVVFNDIQYCLVFMDHVESLHSPETPRKPVSTVRRGRSPAFVVSTVAGARIPTSHSLSPDGHCIHIWSYSIMRIYMFIR